MRPMFRPHKLEPRPLTGLAALLGIPIDPTYDSVELSGVAMDSQTVAPGDLYAALPGSRTHGARFATAAAAEGAVAILTDPAGAPEAAATGLPTLVVDRPREILGRVSAWVYDDPARDLLMFGVTGTNGKTTTTYLLTAVLRAVYGETGLIGTVETQVGAERLFSIRTTPEAPDVHALLAVMRERFVRACAMEVSSHALAFGRVDGVVFDVVGFTNLSQDHLDFHQTMDNYYAAKASLFTSDRAETGVVCVDDDAGHRLSQDASIPIVTVATRSDVDADWRATNTHALGAGRGTRFALVHRAGRRHEFTAPLPGDFNVTNTALAAVMLLTAGIEPEQIHQGLRDFPGVPGRMERITTGSTSGPVGFVDYAHTPDAIERALQALRAAADGRLFVVLGAGGDRDRAKRPAMGEAAARHADVVIVTDDNPRSEPPNRIRQALLDGARRIRGPNRAEIFEEPDRRTAIRLAVTLAQPDDVILVAGKGHEAGQEIDGVVHPFDDRVELRAALEAVSG
jgi:UDP-N-acetylmuramoyl-L-alanyl-D-glutamate--2,6-diaminopimelate ligase